MTTPLLEATYLLQASAAAIEAIQVPFLLDAYIPSVFSLMYTYLPSLNPHNWQPNQRAERWPSPRPSPLLHNPRPNQDPQPIPEANPTLRAREINHHNDPLDLDPHLKHRRPFPVVHVPPPWGTSSSPSCLSGLCTFSFQSSCIMPLIYHSQLTSFVLGWREGGNPSSRSVKNEEEKMDVQFRVLTGHATV